jgi:thioredoxin reductase
MAQRGGMEQRYDVVVIGGGAAGLSGAVSLARFRRPVVVIDSGMPRNAPADGVHNFLTRDGLPPGELVAAGRAELARYGGELIEGEAVSAHSVDGGFRVELADGRVVEARRLLVTTGLTDELPDLPGLAERWGQDVVHCPYCHGWEVRDQAIGVLGSPAAVHQALLFRQLSADVTVFANDTDLDGDERERLAAMDIALVDGRVVGWESGGVRLAGGDLVPRQALVVSPRFSARAGVLASLGLTAVDREHRGHLIGQAVPAEPGGATSVPGVWVAGNVTDPMAQVVSAAAAGLMAGAAINADLIEQDVRIKLDVRRGLNRQPAPAGS